MGRILFGLNLARRDFPAPGFLYKHISLLARHDGKGCLVTV